MFIATCDSKFLILGHNILDIMSFQNFFVFNHPIKISKNKNKINKKEIYVISSNVSTLFRFVWMDGGIEKIISVNFALYYWNAY